MAGLMFIVWKRLGIAAMNTWIVPPPQSWSIQCRGTIGILVFAVLGRPLAAQGSGRTCGGAHGPLAYWIPI